jgi:hypothetical protein
MLIAITNLLELIYHIFQFYENEDNENILKIKDKLKWVSLFHTLLLLILSWMAFVKMKIKTTVFY